MHRKLRQACWSVKLRLRWLKLELWLWKEAWKSFIMPWLSWKERASKWTKKPRGNWSMTCLQSSRATAAQIKMERTSKKKKIYKYCYSFRDIGWWWCSCSVFAWSCFKQSMLKASFFPTDLVRKMWGVAMLTTTFPIAEKNTLVSFER